MRAPITLTFNGAEYVIRPLTLGQVERIEGVVLSPEFGGIRQGKAILGVALDRDHADVDVDGIEATAGDLKAAIEAIFALAGFEQGEARPAGRDASTGPSSEAG